MHDNYLLRRRYFFWDNFCRDIEHLISDFKAQAVGSFIDEFDKASIAGIDVFLKNAQMLALKRYHSALGEFIDAVDQQEAQS